jgi:hypothetical protein
MHRTIGMRIEARNPESAWTPERGSHLLAA